MYKKKVGFKRRTSISKKKSNYTPKKQSNAHIAQIAKTVVLHREQTKTYYQSIRPSAINFGDIKLYNLYYYLDVGTGKTQRVGAKIKDAVLHWRILLNPLNQVGSGVTNAQGMFVRIILFKHTKEWNSGNALDFTLNTGGSGNTIADNEIFYDNDTRRRITSFLSSTEIAVLKDQTVPINRTNPTASLDYGSGKLVTGKINIGNLTFNDSTNNAYLKGKNIYMLITGGWVDTSNQGTVGTDIVAQYGMHLVTNFKNA